MISDACEAVKRMCVFARDAIFVIDDHEYGAFHECSRVLSEEMMKRIGKRTPPPFLKHRL
jgi:hypothetical protein